MQNTAIRVVLIVACVMLIAGSVLTGYMLLNLDSRNIIDVELDHEGNAFVEFSTVTISPGESKEYTMEVSSSLPGDCIVTLDFSEIGDGDLKNYMYAVVEVEGVVICDNLLADIIDSEEPLSTPCRVSKKENFEVKVKYYIPLDVGNEAKNAFADYLLHLTVSNE